VVTHPAKLRLRLGTMPLLRYPPLSISKSKEMELELRVLEMLQQIGISRGQTVLDFGCGYGICTIPTARIVGEQGKVYALDKDREALDGLMQRAESAGLRNINRMETSGEPEIGLTDESIDVVILFDVFHSFYFPTVEDRKRLLAEIHRVMKPSAFLSISLWPNLMEPQAEHEIENADFHLEQEISEALTDGSKDLGTRRILNFRKERHFLSLTNQSIRR
jgi:ubiquinone/menaquinone biosynthesis C-methylase UbiE